MIDLIKPNTEWKEIALDLGGTFNPGGMFTPTQMQIYSNGLTFKVRTSYSNDNLWRARTIIYCTFHYKKSFSLEIRSNFWISLFGKTEGTIKVSKGHSEIRKNLEKNAILNKFRRTNKSFKLTFKTEGQIANDYEVLPMLELKQTRFLTKKEEFKDAFELLSEIAKELYKEKVMFST